MLFNSLYFLVFFLFVLGIFHLRLQSWAARKRFLLAASWLFYATWSPGFLVVLVGTTALDFALARWIHRVRQRPDGAARARALVVVSVAVNLGLLAFFKYGRFLYQSVGGLVTLPPPPAYLAVVVPLGISFYTFHSISYVVDTYRGLRPPTDSFPDFALYVAFFPQLVAGPITRWGFFGPQLEAPRQVRFEGVERALFLIAVGLVKKVVCADSLGLFVDRVYAGVGHSGWLEILIALYAYAFQIYFDFSGYTDMAMGLAGLLGFRLPVNFDHPYLAESPSEFWRRWHISLSTWLRDYLYISLGGNRRGTARTYVNLMVTMLLGGLWHGAAWTFVLWGGFHGVWLALHRALAGERAGTPALTPRWLRRVVTFHLVCVGWVLFRAGSLATAGAMLAGLFSGRGLWEAFPVGTLAVLAVGVATHLFARQDLNVLWFRVPRVVQGAVYGVVIVMVGLLSAHSGRFIYFQF
jgi:D-alanyl-lipoteichoic acid acyltransferase DltB (MBOAT superfamily)